MNTIPSERPNNISWSDVYLTAESECEIFSNMNIVTAKSEVLISARSHAVKLLLTRNESITDYAVDELARHRLDKIKVYEQARVDKDGARVCLDVDVIDDDSIWKALDLVYKAITNGGVWTAKDPVSYSWDDLIKSDNSLES